MTFLYFFLCKLSLNLLQRMNINKDVHINICYPFPEELGKNYARFIVTFKFLSYYAIPLSIIGIFYVLIAKHLIRSHVPGEIQSAHRQVITSTMHCNFSRVRHAVACLLLSYQQRKITLTSCVCNRMCCGLRG